MKKNKIIAFLSLLLIVSAVINSCSKQNETTSIQALFTSGTWELASVKRYDYIGSSQIDVVTLDTSCNIKEFFTFPTPTTCTFTNFHCVSQSKSGSWSLSTNNVYLQSNIALTDTLPGDSCCTTVHPFANAAIVNIGQYSLLLETGDIGAYYTENQVRTIYRYGFVRESSTSN